MGLSDLVDEALQRAAAQERLELTVAGALLSLDPPGSVLEIGSASGGALWFWSQIATPNARIASIDISHHDIHDDFKVRSGQQLLMHLGDSRDPHSLQAVTEFFDGPIDFLFIDGDHSYRMACGDWLTYKALVRSGGWVGFHDIEGPYVEDGGSWKLWQEIRSLYPHNHVEIQLRREGGMGIGLVKMA